MLIDRPEYVIDRYQQQLADRATRRALRRLGLALVLALLVGAAIGVMT